MAPSTTTSSSQLFSSFLRFDSEFFRPAHVEISRRIRSIPHLTTLGMISQRITQGSNPSFSESGLACVNGKNVYFGTMTEGDPNFVSPSEFDRLSGYRLRRNDLVVTLKHATRVGRAWIVENDEPRIFSRNIGLIRLRGDSPIKPSVLLLYLWTTQGQFLLERCATGGTTGQITLPMSELRQIPIPLFESSKQREIEALFLRSRESALQAKESYIQAENLMSRTLNLGSSDFNRPIGYRASFKEAQRSLRFDAERYYPEFDRLISNLPVGAITAPLGSLLHYCRRGKQPIYSDRGLPVLNSKHVLENRIVLEGNRFAVQPADRSTEIRFGDVLINGTGRGTIGRAAPYLVPNNSAIPDNHVTILRSAELEAKFFRRRLAELMPLVQ